MVAQRPFLKSQEIFLFCNVIILILFSHRCMYIVYKCTYIFTSYLIYYFTPEEDELRRRAVFILNSDWNTPQEKSCKFQLRYVVDHISEVWTLTDHPGQIQFRAERRLKECNDFMKKVMFQKSEKEFRAFSFLDTKYFLGNF